MMTCDAVQERLAELGRAAAMENPALSDHLANCADCQALLAALEMVDAGLAELDSFDAPDALVAKTLEAVKRADRPARGWSLNRPWIAGAMAASLVVLASAGLVGELWRQSPFKDAGFSLQGVDSSEMPAPVQSPPPQSPVLRSELRSKDQAKNDLVVGGKASEFAAEQNAGDREYAQSFADGPVNQEEVNQEEGKQEADKPEPGCRRDLPCRFANRLVGRGPRRCGAWR